MRASPWSLTLATLFVCIFSVSPVKAQIAAYSQAVVNTNFEDISTTGTSLILSDDSHQLITSSFPFMFYSQEYTIISVGSNGLLYFADLSHSYYNSTIPYSGSPQAFIAPLWDDLNPAYGGNVFYETRGTAPSRRLIVQWNNIQHYGGSDPVTFQVVLEEGSNIITSNYLDVDFANTSYNNGASATVGIQENSNSGMLFSYNQASLANNFALSFTPVEPLRSNLLIEDGFKIGIGTLNPQEALSVNGTVLAKEIKVSLDPILWPDYVFKDSYDLKPLNEVESFIRENRHLPGAPSAQEIHKNGLAMSKMLIMQMAKIEELTLHLIEQNKQLSAQSVQVIELKKQNEEFRKKSMYFDELEKRILGLEHSAIK